VEIKSRYGGYVLFEGKHRSIKLCAEAAIKAKISLRGADLYDAKLCEANLRGAVLRGAVLCGADLRKADLRKADLHEADLRGADLYDAKLCEANLRGAVLCGADLRKADLRKADLHEANLRGAVLCEANLRGAVLENRKIVPSSGSFFAWKKGGDGEIIKIKIPSWARRTSCLTNRKCRAEFVITLEITKEGKPVLECCGGYDQNTIYRVGKCTAPDKYDPDERVDCSHGIHFFLTRKEAEKW
jgi:uncharacterized protein YjbI with pentapeptide repeats